REDLARCAVEQIALLGEDQAARMTMEERHRKAFLERADLPADGGLAEVQRFAGMGEAARFRHSVENSELVPIHRCRNARASIPPQRAIGPRRPPRISPLRAP